MSIRNLDRLLSPASVAVIGASSRPASVGATVWRNLRAGRFEGPLYAVNPKHAKLDGVAVFTRVGDLPQAPDLAVICTPPATVAGLIEELGRLGTCAAIVMTAGLAAAQKKAMLDAARPHLLRVLGPNCLGLLSPHLGLNATFAHTDALAGDIAFVSQSGALLTAIDIIGDAPVERYTQTLQALLGDPASGAVLFMHAPTAIVRSDDIARACVPFVRNAHDRVMACWLGDDAVAEARRIFAQADVADYATPEEAVRAFSMLSTYRRNQALLTEAPSASESGPPDIAAARRPIDAALAHGRDMLDELEAKAVLQAYGIPTAATVAVDPSADAAADAAAEIGYPVVLKILSPDISHKSDVGGVKLNLQDETALRAAACEMVARVRQQKPQTKIAGFTVQSMVERPLAQELIVGASVDPLFGPVLLFGQGGTAVEVIADRVIALPPLNRVLAREQIARTRVARLLAGYRDHPPARLDAICDVLMAVSQMLADLPELVELDINPLWADHEGVIALDARVRVSSDRPSGADRFAIAPYPVELVETVDWQGEPIVLRPIRPEDEAQHREFLEHLEPQDIRFRVFMVRRDLPRSELARLVQIDYAREMAFLSVRTLPDGGEQTLGVVRAVTDPDNMEAEYAIVVRSDLKGRGLGHLLTRKMIEFAAGRGTQRLAAYVLPDNGAMRGLARSHGFELDAARSSVDAQCFMLSLSATTGAAA